MWNTSLPLPGLLLAPITTIFGPVLTFNLLLALGWPVGLERRPRLPALRAAPSRPCSGGLVYGFSPYMLAQSLGHLQLTLVFLVPLLLLVLDEILVRQRWRPLVAGAALGLLAAASSSSVRRCSPSPRSSAWPCLLLLVVMFPRQVPNRVGYALLALAAAAVVFAALAAGPLALPGHRPPARVSGDLHVAPKPTDLYGLVVPNSVQAIAPDGRRPAQLPVPRQPRRGQRLPRIPLLLILVFTAVRWWRSPSGQGGGAAPARAPGAVHGRPAARRRAAHRDPAALGPAGLPAAAGERQGQPHHAAGHPVRRPAAGGVRRPGRDWAAVPRVGAMVLVAAALLAMVPRVPRGGVPVLVPAFFTGPEVERIPEGSVALMAPYPRPANVSAMFWQAMADLRFRSRAATSSAPTRPAGRGTVPPPAPPRRGWPGCTSGGRRPSSIRPSGPSWSTTWPTGGSAP